MKKRIQSLISSMLVIPFVAFGAGLLIASTAVAQENCELDPDNPLGSSANCAKNPSQPESLPEQFKTITNVLLFLVGAISVIMIIFGGIKYVTSSGDSTKVQEAKNTILYSIIGVIVAILGYAIVNFVIEAFAAS